MSTFPRAEKTLRPLTLLVPTNEFSPTGVIAPGSAIVSLSPPAAFGDPSAPFPIQVWFEGDLNATYRPDNDGTSAFYWRVMHAAGRALTQYPTIATGSFPPQHLRPVARLLGTPGHLVEILDEDALVAWCGETSEEIWGPGTLDAECPCSPSFSEAIELIGFFRLRPAGDNRDPSHPLSYYSRRASVLVVDIPGNTVSIRPVAASAA